MTAVEKVSLDAFMQTEIVEEDLIITQGTDVSEISHTVNPTNFSSLEVTRLEQRVQDVVEDNNHLSSLVEQYRLLTKEHDKSYQNLLDNFNTQREINQILRDCTTKFSNAPDLSSLIDLCKDYIEYYHRPYGITFYMHTDIMTDIDSFDPNSYSHTYSSGDASRIETPHVSLNSLMINMTQVQSPVKALSNFDLSFLSDRRTHDAIVCKIQYSKKILGFILIEFNETATTIDIELLQPLIEIFSNTYSVLSLTLSLATQYGDAYAKAYTDTRTGIANSRQLQADLDSLHGQKYCLIALDIDYFKGVNDKYGHDAGDEALTVQAHTLDKYMRQLGGKGYREGGDEFIGISLAPLDETEKVLTVMMEDIKSRPILDSKNQRFFISNSVGIYQTDGKEHVEIIRKKADLLLYRSKENGRSQYTIDQTITV